MKKMENDSSVDTSSETILFNNNTSMIKQNESISELLNVDDSVLSITDDSTDEIQKIITSLHKTNKFC